MDLRPHELCRRAATGLNFAEAPRRAVWAFDDIATADGHRVSGAWSFSIAVPPDVQDRRMVDEVLMHDRDALLVADAVQHLAPVLTRAASAHFSERPAADLLSESAADSVATLLAAACRKTAFACGLEVLPPFDVRLHSPTLEAAHARADERARAEVDALERAAHLRRAAELSSAMAAGASIPATFLDVVAVPDRAAALGATFAATATRAGAVRPLYVVAGRSLLRFDLTGDTGTPALTVRAAADEIGALRCVQPIGDGRTALGGQRGVQIISSDDAAEPAESYRDDASDSPLAYNAVAVLGGQHAIWATHSQNGVVSWRAGETGAPAARHPAFTGAGGLVRIDDDALAFAAGARVHAITSGSIREGFDAQDDVVAIVPQGGRLHVLSGAGQWRILDARTWRVTDRRETGGRVNAAAALPWLDRARLLLARPEGPVDCLGVDDTLVTRYASRHVGLRAVAGSATHVAALSADRQRVIVWLTTDGRMPVAEMNIVALSGHRAGGIGFG